MQAIKNRFDLFYLSTYFCGDDVPRFDPLLLNNHPGYSPFCQNNHRVTPPPPRSRYDTDSREEYCPVAPIDDPPQAGVYEPEPPETFYYRSVSPVNNDHPIIEEYCPVAPMNDPPQANEYCTVSPPTYGEHCEPDPPHEFHSQTTELVASPPPVKKVRTKAPPQPKEPVVALNTALCVVRKEFTRQSDGIFWGIFFLNKGTAMLNQTMGSTKETETLALVKMRRQIIDNGIGPPETIKPAAWESYLSEIITNVFSPHTTLTQIPVIWRYFHGAASTDRLRLALVINHSLFVCSEPLNKAESDNTTSTTERLCCIFMDSTGYKVHSGTILYSTLCANLIELNIDTLFIKAVSCYTAKDMDRMYQIMFGKPFVHLPSPPNVKKTNKKDAMYTEVARKCYKLVKYMFM